MAKSSRLAQFMVFLNGLILTITAFLILSIFIEEMQKESIEEHSQLVFSEIKSFLGNSESAFTSAGLFIEEKQAIDFSTLKTLIPDLNNFSALALVPLFETESRGTFAGNFPAGFSNQHNIQLQRFTFDQGSPEVVATQYNDNTQALILGQKIELHNEVYALLAVVHLDQELASIKNDIPKEFHRLEIQTYMGQNILNKDFSSQSQKNQKNPLFAENIYETQTSLDFGDSNFILTAHLERDQRSSFLAKIPFLLFLFGLTLTLIGTLYVRNNQKQSAKLAHMNRVLAKKNLELNNEISARGRLNQQIQNSEKENRAILDAVSDIIFELDENGDIIFLNSAWKRITGLSRAEFFGRNLTSLLHPQDRNEQKEFLTALVRGDKEAYRNFARLKTHQGTYRSVELAVSVVYRNEHNQYRIVGTITDVEERRRAERALSEAEKKYRTIVQNAAGGIYQVTPEGHFLSANPALARIFGYDKPEDLLRNVRNVNSEVYLDQERRQNFLERVSQSTSPVKEELQVHTCNGDIVWIIEKTRAVKSQDDQLLYFEGSIEDISERKQAEEALKDAKIRSDLANRAKSEFLANISHELRTPLNSIIGFSEIIKDQVFGPIGTQAYWEYAKDIHDSGKNLLSIINNILDVSRIEAGERQLNESLIDIDKIISQCLSLMSPKLEQRQLRFNFEREQLYPKLVGEELAFKQMLSNLISNAIKFSSEGGIITINCAQDHEKRLRISVTDTGIGMTEEEVMFATSPFNTSSDEGAGWNGNGTGLGLTLVDSLIKLHGGEIELVSQKGVGTTATLIFPRKRVARAQENSTKEEIVDSPIVSEDEAVETSAIAKTIH